MKLLQTHTTITGIGKTNACNPVCLQTDKNTERKLLWDEENRLEAIDDNGFVSNYWYDAAGERTVKTSGESEQMYVNGLFSGGNTSTANFTAYVNPYLVVSKGGNYTKHIYIGSQRIVSKLGDLDSYGADPHRIAYAGANVDGAKVQYANKYTALQQTIKDRYAKFEVEYYGKDNDDYVNGAGFCCDDTPQNAPMRAPTANDNPELFQYYYHSDHLGSTSLITNLDGEVVQHIEYVPFGEVFLEERNNKWNTPYLFNAKELDEETGLYYYGARYYDPRISLWLSADPMQEKYPNVGTYVYCVQNPIKYTDPTGMEGEEEPKKVHLILYGAGHLNTSTNSHNTGNAFEKSANALKKKIESSKSFDPSKEEVKVVYTPSSERFTEAINSQADGSIETLTVFSHGYLGANGGVSLGGEREGDIRPDGSKVTREEAQNQLTNYDLREINANNYTQLKSEKFSANAQATFYGCYIGGATKYDDATIKKFCMAQKLADWLVIPVYAFTGSGFLKRRMEL
jgi:RHS repeat-associated protein